MFLSTVGQCGECSQIFCELDQVGQLWSFLAALAVCTISSVPSVPWGSVPRQLQMTRHSVETEACSRLLWLLLQCTADILKYAAVHTWSAAVQTKYAAVHTWSSPLARSRASPLTCHALPHACPGCVSGPKAQNFFQRVFWITSHCPGSIAQTTSWFQDLSSNQRTYFSTKALSSVHGPWPVRVVFYSSAKFPKYFSCKRRAMQSTQPSASTPTELLVNKCVLQRPHSSRSRRRRQGIHAPAGLGQAAERLSTKPAAVAADSHSATIRQLYLLLLSNSIVLFLCFFDLIMTKQCLTEKM